MKQSLQIFSLILAVTFLLTACGPNATQSEVPSGAVANFLPAANSEPAEIADNTATAVPIPSPSIEVEINQDHTQTDAKGIPVGFTEDGHPYRGNPNAAVVIEEFSDFQCPYCAGFSVQTLPSLDNNQIAEGDVLLIYYDFPLNAIHPQAAAAANAVRCAGEQSIASYWAMHDVLFANQQAWSIANPNAVFSQYGQDLGLEMAQFDGCLASNKYAAQIQADLEIGQKRGVNSTPTFFINNQTLLGAQPIEVFNQAITAVQNGQPLTSNQPATQPTVDPSLRITPVSVSVDSAAATMGDPDAPVTIVEFTDYQCPFCLRHHQQTLPQIIENMVEAGEVYYILKDFPLESIHPQARLAAVAVRCAGDQDAYWQMHDAVFDAQQQWSGQSDEAAKQVFGQLAGEMGLNITTYNACLSSDTHDAAIQSNLNEGYSLGIQGTPHFFINGFPISGAQPYELFSYAFNEAQNGTLADAYTYQPPAAQAQPTPAPPSGPVEISIEGAYSIGDPDAPITIVEFTDYQCPFCLRHFQQTLPQLLENYINTGQVRYVFKDFPLISIHPQAFLASEAARCAGDQEAYLEMHDKLFNTQQEWNGRNDAATLFAGYAEELGLDGDSFSQCLSTHKYEDAVQADVNEGASLGVSGTPAFFLNGYSLYGAQPYEVFVQAIQQLSSQ